MKYETIIFNELNQIATVTINRPKVMNALNPEVLEELADAFTYIKTNESIKCVIITGTGEKAFVAGADVTAMIKMTALEGRKFALRGQEILFMIEKLDRPVIAAVNGYALGGGNEIAMACDFIYASENAKFAQPEINLGIIPGFGGTQRLTRLVGKGWAKELCMTGTIIDANQAKKIGIVNQIFPLDKLMKETIKTADLIVNKGKVSMRAIKYLIDAGNDIPLDRAISIEAECFAVCFASSDQYEGMKAFLEKRLPNFTGSK